MKFAIIKTGGKQYKVVEGDQIKIEKIKDKEGSKVNFSEVLLVVDDKKIKVGQPLVKSAKVEAKVIGQVKGEKIKVFKFKPKKRYKKSKGHRQKLTQVEIKKITG